MGDQLEAKTEENGEPNEKSGKPEADRPVRKGYRSVIIACLGLLAVTIAVWFSIVYLELLEQNDSRGPLSAQELALKAEDLVREKELRAAEAEKEATWKNFHCNLLHRYYDGPEADLPLPELIGLDKDADDAAVRKRCEELLPSVKVLGGWPTSKPQQDNFVVCDGFRYILGGSFTVSILPTRAGLKKNEVSYSAGTEEYVTQATTIGQPTALGRYSIFIVQADDRCVVVAAQRLGRARKIGGRIVRAE